MNRVINRPDQVVEDMLTGWLAAHSDHVAVLPDNPRVFRRIAAPEAGKVGIVTGGGSGHEPAFLGYVGDGLCDAVAIGEIFSSPSAKNFLDAMRAADGGAGVACLYGNYAGDNMNVTMAQQMAEAEGITVRTVVANDDVPSAPKGEEAKRRGVAGEILMWKVGAAKADLGGSLQEVIAVAQKAIDATRSIGVGLSACVIPAVGKANFSIEHGTMEVGIGHHGEPGIMVRKTAPATELAELMLATVLPDLPIQRGDRVAVLVSGLGATPLMEQYILYGELAKRLEAAGIDIAMNFVGNLFTSLEMMGVTVTLMKLDEELESCLQHPCQSVGLTVPGTATSAKRDRPSGAAAERKGAIQPVVTAAVAPTPPRSVQGPSLALRQCGGIVRELIAAIDGQRQYLSEIDGLIGDGDHGINMAKGFNACGERLDALGSQADDLVTALQELTHALMDDIGGSMGPLYGGFFLGLAQALKPHAQLDAQLFGDALAEAVARVQKLGGAQPGDKTLMDTLVPARAAYQRALDENASFADALHRMDQAAASGRDATKDMQARIGRSARLGPRSIGVLDAGATSAALIVHTLAEAITQWLSAQKPTKRKA